MGVRTVITRLSGHIEDRNCFQVDELARRLLLNPAGDESRAIRTVLANGLEVGRFLDRGIVVNRKIGQAPDTPRTGRSTLRVLAGRCYRLDRDNALD